MSTNSISVFLDVALSLTFFYFVTSMFVSGIVEFINTIFEQRAVFLQKALNKLHDDNTFWENTLKNSPFIQNFEDKWKNFLQVFNRDISYIDAKTFVSAVKGIVFKDLTSEDIAAFSKGNKTIVTDKIATYAGEGTLKNILISLSKESENMKDFEGKLADWYNQYMEQVSGWFKRYTRLVVMAVGLCVTLALNLNSIVITKQLSSDKTLRDSVVQMAIKAAGQNTGKGVPTLDSTFFNTDTAFKSYLKANYHDLLAKDNKTLNASTGLAKIQYQEAINSYLADNVKSLGLPIGYNNAENSKYPCRTFFGWLLTVAALSFGAPFWFDLLVKLVNLRNVMNKPEAK